MPPRITRNSHRPRASDRTMVDLESPSLVALAHSTVPLTHRRALSQWAQVTLPQGSLISAGWISRKPLPSGRGRSFFLTSLLIELIDVARGSHRSMSYTSLRSWTDAPSAYRPSARRGETSGTGWAYHFPSRSLITIVLR